MTAAMASDGSIPVSPEEAVACELAHVRGVSKRYGKTVALSNLDLSIRRGETLGLLGPNGCD